MYALTFPMGEIAVPWAEKGRTEKRHLWQVPCPLLHIVPWPSPSPHPTACLVPPFLGKPAQIQPHRASPSPSTRAALRPDHLCICCSIRNKAVHHLAGSHLSCKCYFKQEALCPSSTSSSLDEAGRRCSRQQQWRTPLLPGRAGFIKGIIGRCF